MFDSDCQAILETVLSDAKSAGADAADVMHIISTDISVSQRLGQPEDSERAESSGVGIRVFVADKYAVVSSTDMSRSVLKDATQRAVTMARASIDDAYSRLSNPNEWAETQSDLDIFDAHEPSVEWMREQCMAAEDAARAHEGITNSEGAEMSASRHDVTLASSNGLQTSYRSSSYALSVSVLGATGDKMERDYAYTVARHLEDMKDATAIGNEAAQRTLKRLNSKKQSTAQVPVIFEPRIAKSLLGYFVQAINGSAIARGTSFLKDKMGESLFHPSIRIHDDPHRLRGLASKPCDAEGLGNAPLRLVEDGVLSHWLMDIRSANQLGLKSNGRASRGLGSTPSPSSTNVYMEPGSVTPEELIQDIKTGFFVTDAFGMGVNLVTGDYSQGAGGFWIENGELTYPVSELTLAGHLLDMFKQLTPANDLQFDYAMNIPTVRIDRMTVAGV